MSMSEIVDDTIAIARTTHKSLEMEATCDDSFTFWEKTGLWGIVSFTFTWVGAVEEWVLTVGTQENAVRAFVVEEDTPNVVAHWLETLPAFVDGGGTYVVMY